MTRDRLLPLVEQYRAGLDAELMLLYRLQAIAVEQRRASQTGSIVDIHPAVDDRNRVLTTLLTVERELKALRQLLLAGRQALADLPAFQEVVDRHNEAVDLVADIIAVDRDSLDALKEVEQAGRLAGHPLEHADSTRAADHLRQSGTDL